MRIVHISDTHFGTEVPAVVEALAASIRKIDPALIILSGDVTQRARRSQFAAAERFLVQFKRAALFVIPGNHDIPLFNLWARFTRPYGNYLGMHGAALQPVYQNDLVQVIGLKTTSRWRHKDGKVTAEQRQYVRELLAQGGDRRKFVVCHHPFDFILDQDRSNLMENAAESLRSWSAAGLNFVLGGHIHYPFLSHAHVRHPEIPRQDVHILQAGTACSSRVRNHQVNNFNLIEVDPEQDRVYRYDYEARLSSFVRRSMLVAEGHPRPGRTVPH